MKKFIIGLEKYIGITDQCFDLVGRDNVIFYQNDGKQWMFQLGNVIKTDYLAKTFSLFEKLSLREVILDSTQVSYLLNSLAFIRIVNALGLKLGLGKIVKVSLSELQLSRLVLIKNMVSSIVRGIIVRSEIFPRYVDYKNILEIFFEDINSELLVFRKHMRWEEIVKNMPKTTPQELMALLHQPFEVLERRHSHQLEVGFDLANRDLFIQQRAGLKKYSFNS